MRLVIALLLLPFLLAGQTVISSNAIMDTDTPLLTAPCAACSPWRYSRQDSTLRRWDYTQLRWERVPTEDQVLSISNDTLFLTNGGFVLLPTGEDLTGIRDTVAGLYDIIMNGDTNTANVLRIFVPTSIITFYGGDPKAPTDSVMTLVAQAYQLAGQARPGSILVSQVAATSSNPSHQAPSINSSTPFNVWFWDGLRVTRISYGTIAVDLQDTLAGGLNTIEIEPAPDATLESVLDFIDNNNPVLSMPNGTLLYWVGDGSVTSPDTVWVVLDNVSDTTRVALIKSKAPKSLYIDSLTILGGSIDDPLSISRYYKHEPDIYSSVEGNNLNSGNLPFANKTINNSISDSQRGEKIGVFPGTYYESIVLGSGRKIVGFDTIPSRYPAQVTGVTGATNISKTSLPGNSYKFTGIGSSGSNVNYDFILLYEVDTVLEKSKPISARKPLTYFVGNDTLSVDNTPGSYTFSNLTSPYIVYFNPSLPDTLLGNGCRYEYTSRFTNTIQDSALVDKIHFYGAISGYGPISGGAGLVISNSTIGGGGTHHSVIESGLVTSTLYYNNNFISGYPSVANVFFHPNASGDFSAKMENSIMLNVMGGSYSHKSSTPGTPDYRLIQYNGNAFWGTKTLSQPAISANVDTKTIQVNNNFITDFDIGFSGRADDSVTVVGNYFLNCTSISAGTPTDVEYYFSDNIFDYYVDSVFSGVSGGGTLFSMSTSTTNGSKFSRNLVIAETRTGSTNISTIASVSTRNFYIANLASSRLLVNNTDVCSTTTSCDGKISDYNVFIHLGGTGFAWNLINAPDANPNVFTLADWKTKTGLDQNSIFIDLTSNPLGLRAIFNNPEEGDYSLDPLGQYYDQITALGQVGPIAHARKLEKPNVDDAALLCFSGKGAGGLKSYKYPFPTYLGGLDNVSISSPLNLQYLGYNSTTNKWENKGVPVSISGSISTNQVVIGASTSSVQSSTANTFTATTTGPATAGQLRPLMTSTANGQTHVAYSIFPNFQTGGFTGGTYIPFRVFGSTSASGQGSIDFLAGTSIAAPVIRFIRSAGSPSTMSVYCGEGANSGSTTYTESTGNAGFQIATGSSNQLAITHLQGSSDIIPEMDRTGITRSLTRFRGDAAAQEFILGSDRGASSTPVGGIIRSGQKNNAAPDIAGSNLTLQGGRGTGNNTTAGTIIFQTPNATTSGSTLQSYTTKATVTRDGFQLNVLASTTQTKIIGGDVNNNLGSIVVGSGLSLSSSYLAVSPYQSDTVVLSGTWVNSASDLTTYKQLNRVTIQGTINGAVIPSSGTIDITTSLATDYRLTLGGFSAVASDNGVLKPVFVQMITGTISVASGTGVAIDLSDDPADALIIQNTYYKN